MKVVPECVAHVTRLSLKYKKRKIKHEPEENLEF